MRLRPLPREVKVLSYVRIDERLEAVRQRVERQWRVEVTLDIPASFERDEARQRHDDSGHTGVER